MAVTGTDEGALVEDSTQAIVLTPKSDIPPEEIPESPAEAQTGTAAALTEAEAVTMENGHVLGAEDLPPPYSPPLLTVENASGALESYEVPAHVLAFVPPDGGVRAWAVMLASFLCNGIIFGIINTSGITYAKILGKLQESGDPNAAFKGCECYLMPFCMKGAATREGSDSVWGEREGGRELNVTVREEREEERMNMSANI